MDKRQIALTVSASALALTIAAAFALGRFLPESTRFQRLVLGQALSGEEGYTSAATDDTLLGQRGVAVSPLRPAGAAEIGGRRVDVVSDGGFIDAGASVEVVRARGARVEVREVREGEA